ncbi:hypothetical protein [Corallococcus terminator]|uniref:hypothetical protein n=1 Tax=Corallococcus terminator TaxID=2316733 RepID=UPI0011C42A14|nr:hypothetical protein [Corallococcus terminator]
MTEPQTPAYPPAPWQLRGQLYLSAWWVPRRHLQVALDPAFELLPNGTSPPAAPLAALGFGGRRPWLSLHAHDFEWELPAALPLGP